jgi:hypothetical protein
MRKLKSTIMMAVILTITAAGCTDDGFDENRQLYIVSSQAVQIGNVELTFDSCTLVQQCDFFYRISNDSDRCIAISSILLPARTMLWSDGTLNVQRRILPHPDDQIRYMFIVLQPGDAFRDAVDVQAITGSRDFSNSSLTLTTSFVECSVLAGASGESFELVSAPITFEPVP